MTTATKTKKPAKAKRPTFVLGPVQINGKTTEMRVTNVMKMNNGNYSGQVKSLGKIVNVWKLKGKRNWTTNNPDTTAFSNDSYGF